MSYPESIIKKIEPFTTGFDNNLKANIDAIDRQLSAKGLLESGQQLKQHHDEFTKLILELLGQIQSIVINDIKNKKYNSPDFSTLRKNTEAVINPLRKSFNSDFDPLVHQLIKNPQSADKQLSEFNQNLDNEMNQFFVSFEQDIDGLSS